MLRKLGHGQAVYLRDFRKCAKIGLPIVISKVIAFLNSLRTVLFYQHCHYLVIFFKINERKPEQKMLNENCFL